MSHITQIVINNFRNYRHADIIVGPDPVVLFGANGSGKTNLMEAVSLFAVGTGLRGAKLQDMSYDAQLREQASDGAQSCVGQSDGALSCVGQSDGTLAAIAEPAPEFAGGHAPVAESASEFARAAIAEPPSGAHHPQKVEPWSVQITLSSGVTLSTGFQGGRRLCRVQGAPVKSAAQFHEYLNVIHVTPDMDHIFTDAPCERRRMVDRFIESYYPQHAANLSMYEKAMHQRLTLLRKTINPDVLWLDSLEKVMAQQNVKITMARQDLMKKLMAGQAYHVPLFPRFWCKMDGQVEGALDSDKGPPAPCPLPDDSAEVLFAQTLCKQREVDRAAGMTTFGCHRSDFYVTHQAKARNARDCSTGEQQMLLMSVVLSFVYQKIQSLDGFLVLLLDDVIARLDHAHRDVLFEQVERLSVTDGRVAPVQTFFSGTDVESFRKMQGANFFEVNKAVINKTVFYN
ncbi:MAG: AAA family ATPase [Holosporales bacterium]|jgi:DNA replication and repair protein RecF|nr:AAA family ATPase [Holosporales bacterium]